VAQSGTFLACVAGAAIVVAWVAVFPAHSFGHGWFMVRMMLAPIALGWAALLIEAGRLAQRPPASITPERVAAG
jgi:hypothetical protein